MVGAAKIWARSVGYVAVGKQLYAHNPAMVVSKLCPRTKMHQEKAVVLPQKI